MPGAFDGVEPVGRGLGRIVGATGGKDDESQDAETGEEEHRGEKEHIEPK